MAEATPDLLTRRPLPASLKITDVGNSVLLFIARYGGTQNDGIRAGATERIIGGSALHERGAERRDFAVSGLT